MKSPCAKDCPNRNETCHTTCEKYLKFYEENAERREKMHKDAEALYLAYFKDRNVKTQK